MRFAMQRAAEVHLSEIKVQLSNHATIERLIFKGLDITKFRENLDQVPSLFQNPAHLGLTLKVLNGYRDKITKEQKLNFGGLGAVSNLWSRPFYDDYLLIGTGIYGVKIWNHADTEMPLNGQLQGELPLWLSGLLTLSEDRKTQLRIQLAENFHRYGHEIDIYESFIKLSLDLPIDERMVGFIQLLPSKNRHLGGFSLGVEWHPY